MVTKIFHVCFERDYMETPSENPGYAPVRAWLVALTVLIKCLVEEKICHFIIFNILQLQTMPKNGHNLN